MTHAMVAPLAILDPSFPMHLISNLLSAYQQPKVIDNALKKECELGYILGPHPYPFLYFRNRSGP